MKKYLVDAEIKVGGKILYRTPALGIDQERGMLGASLDGSLSDSLESSGMLEHIPEYWKMFAWDSGGHGVGTCRWTCSRARFALSAAPGRDLGRSIALEMAAEGGSVMLLERNPDTLHAVARRDQGSGRRSPAFRTRRHRLRFLSRGGRRHHQGIRQDRRPGQQRGDQSAGRAPSCTIRSRTGAGRSRSISNPSTWVRSWWRRTWSSEVGPDHPHRLDPGLRIQRRSRRLQCRKGRHHRSHQIHGGRARTL